VGFAQIGLAGEGLAAADPTGTLLESLVPGTYIVRYGRAWRMGQWSFEDGYAVGRIGYERPGEVAELWDERINDFARTTLPEGVTSPFVVSMEQMIVAFQLRAGRIKPTSFTGAFQALLNDATWADWRVRPLVRGVNWEIWRESVDRVERVEVVLPRPNPNYRGREHIEQLIEGAHARRTRIVWEASEEDLAGLNLDDAFVRESIEHALDEDAKLRVSGVEETDVGPRQTQWRSEVEGVPQEGQAEVNPETGEAEPEALRREVDEYLEEEHDPEGG
jgi:hypothetical protein